MNFKNKVYSILKLELNNKNITKETSQKTFKKIHENIIITKIKYYNNTNIMVSLLRNLQNIIQTNFVQPKISLRKLFYGIMWYFVYNLIFNYLFLFMILYFSVRFYELILQKYFHICANYSLKIMDLH